MAEWLKAHAWKACLGETLTWVRIPLSPPASDLSFTGVDARATSRRRRRAESRLKSRETSPRCAPEWRGAIDETVRRRAPVQSGFSYPSLCPSHQQPLQAFPICLGQFRLSAGKARSLERFLAAVRKPSPPTHRLTAHSLRTC